MYTMSDKRIKSDLKKANWSLRLKIFRLRQGGWSHERIGNELGLSKQRVHQHWNKIKTMSEAEIKTHAENK